MQTLNDKRSLKASAWHIYDVANKQSSLIVAWIGFYINEGANPSVKNALMHREIGLTAENANNLYRVQTDTFIA